MDRISLDNLEPGELGTIEKVETTSLQTRLRLLEMGLTKGTVIELIRHAPMGDPIEIAVRGYRLSLRRNEAACVFLTTEH